MLKKGTSASPATDVYKRQVVALPLADVALHVDVGEEEHRDLYHAVAVAGLAAAALDVEAEAVSYTHLDVYKRQVDGVADGRTDRRGAAFARLLRAHRPLGVGLAADAVSYTHLDVYKRQTLY